MPSAKGTVQAHNGIIDYEYGEREKSPEVTFSTAINLQAGLLPPKPISGGKEILVQNAFDRSHIAENTDEVDVGAKVGFFGMLLGIDVALYYLYSECIDEKGNSTDRLGTYLLTCLLIFGLLWFLPYPRYKKSVVGLAAVFVPFILFLLYMESL